MKITRENLKLLAPTDLHEGVVLNRLHYYFCTPMTRRGLCTEICKNCKDDLNRIVNNGKDRRVARDRVALIVYEARNVMAEKAEQRPRKDMVKNEYGDVVDENPFDMFIDEISDI